MLFAYLGYDQIIIKVTSFMTFYFYQLYRVILYFSTNMNHMLSLSLTKLVDLQDKTKLH